MFVFICICVYMCMCDVFDVCDVFVVCDVCDACVMRVCVPILCTYVFVYM